MKTQEAKNSVVTAGRRLLETGLIARTWGNVSCRTGRNRFAITPSGRDYKSLTPDDIVEVAIEDLSYEGDVKPSSELRVHAEVYKLRPETNFVIHTHQMYASVAGVLLQDSIKISEEDYPLLGGEVICAAYGLPGTKKLSRNVAEALAVSRGKAVIMKNHGALCFGHDCEEAFKVAHELEAACEKFIKELILKSGLCISGAFQKECRSVRTASGFRFNSGEKSVDIADGVFMRGSQQIDDEVIAEVEIHDKVYKSYPSINCIIHTATPAIFTASSAVDRLLPYLDDFAQIVGTSVVNVGTDSGNDPGKITSALKRSSAVLIKNGGALCCGASEEDAQAVSLVMEKNCLAHFCAMAAGKAKPINRFEASLMRLFYLKKYSKRF